MITPIPVLASTRFLCLCECGQRTALIKATNIKRGYVRGQFKRYVHGHNIKGTKASEDTRSRIAKAKVGSKNPMFGMKREKNPNWKGGLGNRTGNQFGRNSPANREWRISVYERDDYTCQECGQRGGRLNAHHIEPWAKHPELRYDLDNGITLCAEMCHKKAHARKGVKS